MLSATDPSGLEASYANQATLQEWFASLSASESGMEDADGRIDALNQWADASIAEIQRLMTVKSLNALWAKYGARILAIIRANRDKYAALGFPGYRDEIAGNCTVSGCSLHFSQSSIADNISGVPADAVLLFHTHPNVGLPVNPDDMSHYSLSNPVWTVGYSAQDAMAEKFMVENPQIGRSIPMAIISLYGGGGPFMVTMIMPFHTDSPSSAWENIPI